MDAIAPTLIGGAHLLYAGHDEPPPADAVRRMVTSVLAGALPPA